MGGEAPVEWVARTDAALYSAKRGGKGQAVSA
jgi:PleD family two-component response regulator